MGDGATYADLQSAAEGNNVCQTTATPAGYTARGVMISILLFGAGWAAVEGLLAMDMHHPRSPMAAWSRAYFEGLLPPPPNPEPAPPQSVAASPPSHEDPPFPVPALPRSPSPPSPLPPPKPPSPSPAPPRPAGPPPHAGPVPWPIQPGQKVRATTTDFGFGDLTGCGCHGAKLTGALGELGWVGVATPNWLGTPYHTTLGALPRNGATLGSLMGRKYYSNCASDCGQCWQLETLDELNMGGVKPDKAYTVNVVVLDTCEDRNDYGNNYQWCVAAKGVPQGGVDTNNYAGHVPPFEPYLRGGNFTVADKSASWERPDCFDDAGNWICTNMAGEPLHFDFAIQEVRS